MARFRRGFAGRKPRRLEWCSAGEVGTEGSSFPVTDSMVICDDVELNKYTDPTIVRVRGNITVELERSHSTLTQTLVYAFGLIVLDLNVITVSDILTTSVTRDWMWLHYGRIKSERHTYPVWNGSTVLTSTTTSTAYTGFAQIPVDVRAMRRVKRSEQLHLVFSCRASDEPGASVRVGALLRALIKE